MKITLDSAQFGNQKGVSTQYYLIKLIKVGFWEPGLICKAKDTPKPVHNYLDNVTYTNYTDVLRKLTKKNR